MQFGESLVQLAGDIAAGYGARKASAEARGATLASLNLATRQALAANTAHRMEVAADIAASAAALRKSLVELQRRAQRRRAVQPRRRPAGHGRQARHHPGECRSAARRPRPVAPRGSAALQAFRAEVRSEQAAANKAMAASLDQFVAGVRSETAAVQQAVQAQLAIARGTWGKAPAPKAAAPVPAPKPAPVAAAPRPSLPPSPPPPAPRRPRPVVKAEAAPAEESMSSFGRARRRDAERQASDSDDRASGGRPSGSNS